MNKGQQLSSGASSVILALLAAGLVAAVTGSLYIVLSRGDIAMGASLALCAIVPILTWPAAGVCLLVFLFPIEFFSPLDWELMKILKTVLTAAVAFSLLLDAARHKQLVQQRAAFRYGYILLLVAVSATASAVLSESPLKSAAGAGVLLLNALYYYAISVSRLRIQTFAGLLWLVCLLSGSYALVAIFQAFSGYSGFPYPAWLLSSAAAGALSGPFGFFRGMALMGTPNSAGAVFSIGAFAAWIHVRCFRERKVLFAALGIISALGLLSTFSRGALIGCVCACMVLLVQRSDGRLRRRVLAAGLVLIPIVILAPVHDASSLLRIGQGSGARLEAVQSAWSLVQQHPLAGIGQYTFRDESGDLRGRPGAAWTPHNGLLKALVEQGVPGGILYVCYLVLFIRTSLALMRRTADDPVRFWLATSAAATGACLFGQELVDAGMVLGSSSLGFFFITMLGMQTKMMAAKTQAAYVMAHGSWPASAATAIPEPQ